MSEVEEGLKTAQEVSKAVEHLTGAGEKIGGFLAEMLGPLFRELCGIGHDKLILLRYECFLKIIDRVRDIHKKRKLEGKTIPIPPRFAIPILQNASIEDDESLQEMWASLIANFMDPAKRLTPKRIYIQILSSLEPIDAKILQFFSVQGWKLFREVSGGVSINKLVHELDVNEEEIRLSLQNLSRQGCVIDEHMPSSKPYESSSFGMTVIDPSATFRPSLLGSALIVACQAYDPYEED